MKNFFKILSLVLLFLALPVLAQDTVKLPNPIGPQEVTPNVVLSFAGKVANGFIGVSGTIALVMFIYGGFLWLTSRGEPDKIKKGKDIFIWSVVGLAIIFSSYFLVDFLLRGVTGSKGPRCCVTESKGAISCQDIVAGDDGGAEACAAGNGMAVGGKCATVAACPVEKAP